MNDVNHGAHAALSKTSCLQTAQPLLISWHARALYLGPAFNLAAHRNAVAVLAMGLDAPLGIAVDPANPAAGFIHCRTALIEPNQLHLLDTPGADYAFLYVDALSRDLPTLRARGQKRHATASVDIASERELLALLAGMPRNAGGWRAASVDLANMLGLQPPVADSRVRQVASLMRSAPGADTDAAGFAQAIGLSSSRFQHLFKAQTGVSFRRYRIWARLQATVEGVMAGKTLTAAALDAGFASSAHLSAAFKAMFGLSLTQLLGGNVQYIRTEPA